MIDKDIEIVKEMFFEDEAFKPTEYVEMFFHRYQQQAIENVLKELEKEKTKNLELNIELKTFKQSNKNLLAKKSELETYKKIAEKLAEELTKLTEENKEYYLDWARKEVEKDVVKEYIYLVSYHHGTGCGTITINMNGKINSTEHILEIHKYIEDKNNLKNVGIISYQLVCEKWARKEVEKDVKD